MEVYDEHESELLSESLQTKRNSDKIEDENAKTEEKKSKKRRRSSLASTRRSITGNVPSRDECDSDLPSSHGSSSSSQPQIENKKPGLMVNPLNSRMNEIIAEFEDNISRLDKEYTRWKLALQKLEKEQEQTKLLSESNIDISADEIPQELKDLARKEYMGKTLNIGDLCRRVERSLKTGFFDIHKCLQDMVMFRSSVNSIRNYNKFMKNPQLYDDSSFDSDTASEPSGESIDFKGQLEWMMKN